MAETEAGLARAFLYQAGAMNRFPANSGRLESVAMAINNQGQVAGAATTEDGAAHAFIYDANGIRDIETLGHSSSIAVDINESGQAVGWGTGSWAGDLRFGFYYRDGVMSELKAPTGRKG